MEKEIVETRTRMVGVKVVTNGLIAALRHFTETYQLETKCERVDALKATITILDELKKLVEEEIKEDQDGRSKEAGDVPKESH